MVPGSDEIAWAAGLYDGEGSSSMYVPKRRHTARRQMQVSQGGLAGSIPEVLARFNSIVVDGNVTGPYRGYLFYWKTTRKDVIDRIASDLWPYLSNEKRDQFELMTRAAGRRLPPMPRSHRTPLTERAWAAGLFDGEGSTYLTGIGSNRHAALELPQASAVGIPQTLKRFAKAVGAGWINGPYPPRSAWSRLPQYRWTLAGRDDVSRVLAFMWPWLSAAKRDQAEHIARALGRTFIPQG